MPFDRIPILIHNLSLLECSLRIDELQKMHWCINMILCMNGFSFCTILKDLLSGWIRYFIKFDSIWADIFYDILQYSIQTYIMWSNMLIEEKMFPAFCVKCVILDLISQGYTYHAITLLLKYNNMFRSVKSKITKKYSCAFSVGCYPFVLWQNAFILIFLQPQNISIYIINKLALFTFRTNENIWN